MRTFKLRLITSTHGYVKEVILTAIWKRHLIEPKPNVRENLIYKSKTQSQIQPVRIITTYSKRHRQVKQVMSRNWPLLPADPIVSKYIGKQPQITYRQSKSLKDRLVQRHYTVSKNSTTSPETFPSRTCDCCQNMLNNQEELLPNNQIHLIKHRVTCQTPGIVLYIWWNEHAIASMLGKLNGLFLSELEITLIKKWKNGNPC